MANQRQIPFLHWRRPNAAGVAIADWKPSPRLRKLGWTNRVVGDSADRNAAIRAAMALNEQVAAWEAQRLAGRSVAAPAAPRRHTFADLVTAYRASPEFTDRAETTRREYDVRLRQLTEWALDGRLPIADIDRAMVKDLARELRAGGSSLHRTNAIVRVLSLLLSWAWEQRLIAENPTARLRLEQAAPRQTLLALHEVEMLDAAAGEAGLPSLALGFTLGMWTIQREEDLLALTRMNWRAIDNIDPADAAALANRKGDVMGFRLRQIKTGAWVDCPVPSWLHDRVEAAFDRSQWLCHDDARPDRACPDWQFRRRARTVLNAAGLDHAQFRDLRRSGMCMMRDAGAETPGITAISGHMVLGRKSILDTYMPPNTRAAARAMATTVRWHNARTARENLA